MRSIFCGRDKEIQALQAAWNKVSNKEAPQPQLITLLGESGLGKTRIVQEFYQWLSTTVDKAQPEGYWPDDLGQEENNLRVNPSPEDCRNESTFPYLWWGVRLSDVGKRNSITSSSAIHSYQKIVTPHLETAYQRMKTQQKIMEAGKTGLDAGIDIGISFVEAITMLGPIKTAAMAVYKLTNLGKDHFQDSQSLTTAELEQQDNKNTEELLIEALSGLFELRCPACIFIDDAQFLRTDSVVTSFNKNAIGDRMAQAMAFITHYYALGKGMA